MTKEIIEKIAKPNTPLDVSDMTAEDKNALSAYLSDKGISTSTFYLRFFQKGFDGWEIIGINECKKQFLAIPDIAEVLKTYVETDAAGKELGEKGYLYSLAHGEQPGIFYTCLKKANNGLCTKFADYMYDRGMSRTTLIKRFTSDDWKPWEASGIKPLLLAYLAQS